MPRSLPSSDRTVETVPPDAQERIVAALHGLRFGAVELQVHDGRVVRITRIEKLLVESAPREQRESESKLNRPARIGRPHATTAAGLDENRTSKHDPTPPAEERLQQGTKHS